MARAVFTLTILFSLLGLTLWWVASKSDARREEESATLKDGAARLEPQGVQPRLYRLQLVLLPDVAEFSGTADLELTLARDTQTFVLNGQDLMVEEVSALTARGDTVSGAYQPLEEAGRARLSFEEPLPAGTATVTLRYRAPVSEDGGGLFAVEQGGDRYLFSQLQPLDARRVFPGFDQPDLKAPFEISVITRAGLHVVSNGGKLAEIPLGRDLIEHRFARTPAIPSYAVALAVGPFDVVETPAVVPSAVRRRPVPVTGYAVRGQGAALEPLLALSDAAMLYLEDYLDQAFPFDKLDVVAVPGFPALAMENAGAIFYRDTLAFLDPTDPAQIRAGFAWHGHEIAHQWIGNHVTPRWWNDLWFTESVSVWLGDRVAAELAPDLAGSGGRAALEAAMAADSQPRARRLRQPIESRADIFSAFDILTYQKGAGLMRMSERYLGEEPFRDALRLYVRSHAGGVADTDDFLAALSQVSGRGDLAASLSTYLYQTGLPQIALAPGCTAGRLTLEQQPYRPIGGQASGAGGWLVPVCLKVGLPPDGAVRQQCTMIDQDRSEIRLPSGQCPRWVLPDVGGSGYYRWRLPEDAWLQLFARLDLLAPAERQSVVRNMIAAVEAGQVPLTRFLAVADYLADRADAALLQEVLPFLDLLLLRVAPPEAREGVAAYLRLILGPRLAELGLEERLDEPVAERSLRGQLALLLAARAGDRQTRRALALQAVGYLERPERAPPARLAEPAFLSGVLELGEPFVRAAARYARDSADPSLRAGLWWVLAQADEGAGIAVARAALAGPDLLESDRQAILAGMMVRPETRQANWLWLSDHVDEVAARFSGFGLDRLASVARSFCSDEAAEGIEAFFQRRPDLADRLGASLAGSLDRVRQCAALRAALRPTLSDLTADQPS